MSYLDPPPFPAPVVVMKDVGGLVTDYQARTEDYRATNREVRLHECRSACTLALSLPNVCVYPNSVLKFHLAYDARDHVSNYNVSQQLFDAYPAPVRARLGGLTKDYHVLSGAELIKLGFRDCNEPRSEPKIMVASVGKVVQRPIDQETSLTGMMHGLMSKVSTLTGALEAPVTTGSILSPGPRVRLPEAEKPVPSDVVFANYPMPAARPPELGGVAAVQPQEEPAQEAKTALQGSSDVPLPPARPPSLSPPSLSLAYTQQMPVLMRPKIMGGAAPIIPSTTFVALATIPRWTLPE